MNNSPFLPVWMRRNRPLVPKPPDKKRKPRKLRFSLSLAAVVSQVLVLSFSPGFTWNWLMVLIVLGGTALTFILDNFVR